MKNFIKNTTLTILATFTVFILGACKDNRSCEFNVATKLLACPEKTYTTIDIGGKTWMAENLAVYVPDQSTCYDNNHENCETSGRLYTWQAASNSICPIGWELPTREDFKAAFGSVPAPELKKANVFNMQFAGFKYYDGNFADKGSSASFWTKEPYDDSRAYMVRATETAISYEHYNKNIFASVRCIKQ